MDLHRRKLWGDRLTWIVVVAATGVIVFQYLDRRTQFLLYLLYGWVAVVLLLLFASELRVGRRRPQPGAFAFFAGWATWVGEERVVGSERRRPGARPVPGVLEFTPEGVRWEAPDDDVPGRLVTWERLGGWRINGVVPLLWRASGYLTLTEDRGTERRELVFHIHALRRWRKALRESAIIGPTYGRPDWLPAEAGAELPILLASHVPEDGGPAPVTVVGGRIEVPPHRRRAAAGRPAPETVPEAAGPKPSGVAETEAPAGETPLGTPKTPEGGGSVETAERTEAPEDAYETVIGLECHVELSTDSKVFCGCPTTFGAEPNTQICPVCTGQPGSLPVLNERAVEFALRIAAALHCDVADGSIFHRKNYFYPDMPKNYQISQYDQPLATGGYLDVEVDGELRRIGIHRVHLEEDTGKTAHASASGRIADATHALVDYNRAGVPLVEVVSEPDVRSPEEARAYLTELRALLQAIGVSDVRMEEGSLRCDANVSVRRAGASEFGVKAEVKNMNSIRSVGRALAYEVGRQETLVRAGQEVLQETRHFDEDTGETRSLRTKEYAFDYRYFPEPDLVPLAPDPAWLGRVRAELPELPAQRRRRLIEELGLSEVDVRTLASSVGLADAFEAAVSAYGGEAQAVANWYLGELASLANERGVEAHEVGVAPEQVAEIQRLVDSGEISISLAKGDVLRGVLETGRTPKDVVAEQGLAQISEVDELAGIVDEVIAANEDLVEKVRGGKEGAINGLIGQVMGRTKGKANPQVVRDLLTERLPGAS